MNFINRKLWAETKRLDEFFKREIEDMFGQFTNLQAQMIDATNRTASTENRIFSCEVRGDSMYDILKKQVEEMQIIRNLIHGVKWDLQTLKEEMHATKTRLDGNDKRRVSSKRGALLEPIKIQDTGTLLRKPRKQKRTNSSNAIGYKRTRTYSRRKEV